MHSVSAVKQQKVSLVSSNSMSFHVVRVDLRNDLDCQPTPLAKTQCEHNCLKVLDD